MKTLIALITTGLLVMSGCRQDSKNKTVQDSPQEVVSPTTSTAESAAVGGADVNVWILNAPSKIPAKGQDVSEIMGQLQTSDTSEVAELQSVSAANDNTNQGKAKAGYMQSGFVLNITTGGNTTPTVTGGAATGTTSATQYPSQASAQNPVQEVKPSTSIPIAVGMPGSMQDQQSTATAEGDSTATKTSENRLDYMENKIKAMADNMGQIMEGLNKLAPSIFSDQLPVPIPESQPAPTP